MFEYSSEKVSNFCCPESLVVKQRLNIKLSSNHQTENAYIGHRKLSVTMKRLIIGYLMKTKNPYY